MESMKISGRTWWRRIQRRAPAAPTSWRRRYRWLQGLRLRFPFHGDEDDGGELDGQSGEALRHRWPRSRTMVAGGDLSGRFGNEAERGGERTRGEGKGAGNRCASPGEEMRSRGAGSLSALRWRRGHVLPPPSSLARRGRRRQRFGGGLGQAKVSWASPEAQGKLCLPFSFYLILCYLFCLEIKYLGILLNAPNFSVAS
jgi:hypothetical protein